MFYMRTDANSKLGSGHVMRCLTIAKALERLGENTTFITSDREAENLIKQNGFSMRCLDSVWNNLDDELRDLESLIYSEGINTILIDSYYVTADYLVKIKKCAKIIYIDDLNEFIYPVNLLINYNINAEKLKYDINYPTSTRLLIGCKYIPLREEFLRPKRSINERVKDILITTGGADSYNIAGQLIKYIREKQELNALKIHVVIGPFNENGAEIESMACDYKNIVVYHNVAQMSELMLMCDIALSAGGSTLYELCSCGTPSICFNYADNQLEGAREFSEQGLIYYAGDVRENIDLCMENIEIRLNSLCDDILLRKELSVKMQEVVDGLGADRIAKEILTI